jgi:N-hydroxyarylamine O-acetyltransferase
MRVPESSPFSAHQQGMADMDAYLRRIGYSGSVTPNAETLREIHRAHLFAVPFENLDIGWRREIRVDEEAFVRKIVDYRRGGFCYELNGAFATLLRTLGFTVTLLSARVPSADGADGPEFDHLTLRVDLREPWLADVGFGDCFIDPLRLQVGLEQEQRGNCFRIVEVGESLRVERRDADAGWRTEYLFSLKPHRLEEFADMCRYHQTSPLSPFTRKRVCSRATEDGRITLSDMKLIMTRNGRREERLLESEVEWQMALAEHFGVLAPQSSS